MTAPRRVPTEVERTARHVRLSPLATVIARLGVALEESRREVQRLHADNDRLRQQSVEVQQLIDALADCVVKATPYGVQDGDFVANYIMPTGPIHRAIPLLQERYGITVRPGFDGRTFSQPEEPA